MTTTDSSPTPSPPPPQRSLLAKLHLASWRGRFAWLLTLIFLALATGWVLTRMTPSWYRPLDPDDPNVDATATRAQTLLFFELKNAIEHVSPIPQKWTITQNELNSWLACNTAPPRNADGRRGTLDPDKFPLTDPFVVFSKGSVTLCARYTKIPNHDPQGGVGSLTFSVGIVADPAGPGGEPMGLIKLTGASMGYMPLPKSVIESRLRAMVPTINTIVRQVAAARLGVRNVATSEPFLEEFARGLGEGRPFPLRYTDNGREYVIQDIGVDDGSLTVTFAPARLVSPPTAPRPVIVIPATSLPATLQ